MQHARIALMAHPVVIDREIAAVLMLTDVDTARASDVLSS